MDLDVVGVAVDAGFVVGHERRRLLLAQDGRQPVRHLCWIH